MKFYSRSFKQNSVVAQKNVGYATKITFCGVQISAHVFKLDPSKVDFAHSWELPVSKDELISFLSMIESNVRF